MLLLRLTALKVREFIASDKETDNIDSVRDNNYQDGESLRTVPAARVGIFRSPAKFIARLIDAIRPPPPREKGRLVSEELAKTSRLARQLQFTNHYVSRHEITKV